MFYHVIVTHGYDLIVRSHEEWAWPHMVPVRCVRIVTYGQCLLFSGLRTRLTETLDGEQTVEGEQVNKYKAAGRYTQI